MTTPLQTYEVGSVVTLQVTFKDVNGNLVDPSAATGSIRTPDQITGPLPVAKISLGVWGCQYTITQKGLHQWRIAGTGAFVGADESFFMAQSNF